MKIRTLTPTKFEVDDRVRFDLNGTDELKGTGSVLGLAVDNIPMLYIVLLDIPIMDQKAVCMPENLMVKI